MTCALALSSRFITGMSPSWSSLRPWRSLLCVLCGSRFWTIWAKVKPVTAKIAKLKTAKDANKTTPSFHGVPEHSAIFHHKRHISQDVDIAQRIAVDGDDVGVGAGRYHPDLARHIEHIGGA